MMVKPITCTRRIQFCSGHRVHKHESRCNFLHGHNYLVYVTAQAVMRAGVGLDDLGRVIDFSVLKEKVGGWIDANWDHGFILDEADVEAQNAVTLIKPQKLHLLPYNPTAENMARYLLEYVGPQVLPEGVMLVKVVVHETENCSAEVEMENI